MQERAYSYQSRYGGYICIDLAHSIVLVFLSRFDNCLITSALIRCLLRCGEIRGSAG